MSDFLVLLLAIVRYPRSAARLIMKMDLPTAALWPYLGLVSISYALSGYLASTYSPPSEMRLLLEGIGPMFHAAIFFAYTAALCFGLARLGSLMGGLGGFAHALALMTFLPFMFLVLQAIAFLLIPISFDLFAFVNFFLFGYSIWITICFIDELHRYDSLGKSFMLWLFVNCAILIAALFLMSLAQQIGLISLPVAEAA